VFSYSRRSGTRPRQRQLKASKSKSDDVSADLVIIGGGISGLSAAIEASSGGKAVNHDSSSVVLLESQPSPGGRVSSDIINGFIFDRGYAVFVENYPQSQRLLDYSLLELKKYDPGALIHQEQSNRNINGNDNGIKRQMARIADPLRQPLRIMDAITSTVGTPMDKLRLIPLFYKVKTNSVTQLFSNDKEQEISTLSCLKETYHFSDKMIQEFFEPFLTGIYFCPLEEQSSHMFHFVFKMFAEGAASLPTGGMQAVSNQLMDKAKGQGVDIKLSHAVKNIQCHEESNDNDSISYRYTIDTEQGTQIHCKSIICATEGVQAQKILSKIKGLESLNNMEKQPQRSVGCMYYSFQTETPVKEPILILNGGGEGSGPALTVSFLHIINDSYAPKGSGLCSIAIPSKYMHKYKDQQKTLDMMVRDQLSDWWPDYTEDIQHHWKLEKVYDIQQAQPGQFQGVQPANVHGGRDPSLFGEVLLPDGLFVCGDYMATATLNGAIESGLNAARCAVGYLEKVTVR
jgi:phytoene dehydrogenase-like protein